MKDEELKAITKSIEEKIGAEASGTIADDLGKLYTSNSLTLAELQKKDEEIKNLRSTNEKLVLANGNLLQQIPASSEYDSHQSKEEQEDKKSFNFRSAFDSKGNFKK